MYIVPSPKAATILPAITAFKTLASILIPGTFLSAAITVFAAVLTAPTSTIELKNCFDDSSFLIP